MRRCPNLFFNNSNKNLKWKQHFYTDTSWNHLFLNMPVWWGCTSRRRKVKDGERCADEQRLIIHCRYDVKKLTVTGRINSNFKFFKDTAKNFLWKIYQVANSSYNIANNNSKELLDVVIDSEASFARHTDNLCRKTRQKLHAMARVAYFMTLESVAQLWKPLFCLSLIFVLFYGCVTNLLGYKEGLYPLYTMINSDLFISFLRKTNQ